MPSPKFASGDNFCLGSGVPHCPSLKESEEPRPLWGFTPMWEANPSLNLVPHINEHKLGRVPFHCSKARAYHGVICRVCWIPSPKGSGWATRASLWEVGGGQMLPGIRLPLFCCQAGEPGFFSLWFKVLGILIFVGIRIFGFIWISFGTRED